MDLYVSLGTNFSIICLVITVIYMLAFNVEMKKIILIPMLLVTILITASTYTYITTRIDDEMTAVYNAIANKQKIIAIDITYLGTPHFNKLEKKLLEAGYTQNKNSNLVFTLKEE